MGAVAECEWVRCFEIKWRYDLDKTSVKKASSVRTTIVDQIKEESKKPAETLTPRVEFLTTGSTLLNLALSQKGKDGGVARGRIINIVGDGSSGKTLTALEICAHAYYGMKND